jgi:hypothetical protein
VPFGNDPNVLRRYHLDPMRSEFSQAAIRMRMLAARMRGHAAETSVEGFRRKFENAASELEEAAVDLESRAESESQAASVRQKS